MKKSKKLLNSGLSAQALKKLRTLSTPQKVQDFLNSIPFNFEERGETHRSVEETLKANQAHCFEGALVAAAALSFHGRKPLLLDLKTVRPDFDHVVVLFEEEGHWGAISKTNHNVLRYRDPIYKSIRELVMSYFHEYFLANGRKTLSQYSEPFDLSQEKINWLTGKGNLASLAHKLDRSPHHEILTSKQERLLRKAEKIEVNASGIEEWERSQKIK